MVRNKRSFLLSIWRADAEENGSGNIIIRRAFGLAYVCSFVCVCQCYFFLTRAMDTEGRVEKLFEGKTQTIAEAAHRTHCSKRSPDLLSADICY
jgi:hypothetical protein